MHVELKLAEEACWSLHWPPELIKLRLHLDDSTCTDRSVSPIDFSLIRADLERVTERSRSVLGASCKVSSKLVLLDAT
jgi:hypothetical protein